MNKNKCKSRGCKFEKFGEHKNYCIFHLQHPQNITLWFLEDDRVIETIRPAKNGIVLHRKNASVDQEVIDRQLAGETITINGDFIDPQLNSSKNQNVPSKKRVSKSEVIIAMDSEEDVPLLKSVKWTKKARIRA